MKAGNYELTSTHTGMAAGGFAVGLVYGLLTGKGIGGILLFGVVGSMVAFGASTLIERPVRIK